MEAPSAIFAAFAAASAAAYLLPSLLSRFSAPSPSLNTQREALLGELASAEQRLRALAPRVAAFVARVAAAEAAGREPADRNALSFSLQLLEASDAEHWGAGAGAGCASSAEAGAAFARLRRDPAVAAAAAAMVRAHPLYAPPARIFEALTALNGEELALARAAALAARARGVPLRSAEFEKVQRATLRQRLKELGPAAADAGSGGLLAALCPDLRGVAPCWANVVQLAMACERAGLAGGYEGFEAKLAARTKEFEGAPAAPPAARAAAAPPSPPSPLSPLPRNARTQHSSPLHPAFAPCSRVQRDRGGGGGGLWGRLVARVGSCTRLFAR